MAELTPTDAEQIRFDIWRLNKAKDNIKQTKRNHPGKYNNTAIEKEIATLDERIRRMTQLSPDQPISDIYDVVFHAVNAASSMESRHITVDELPKVRIDKRNGYPDYYKKASKRPGRTPKKTRAKRAAAMVKKMVDGRWDDRKREWVHSGDAITHIESGRVWDAATGATADEFLEVMR